MHVKQGKPKGMIHFVVDGDADLFAAELQTRIQAQGPPACPPTRRPEPAVHAASTLTTHSAESPTVPVLATTDSAESRSLPIAATPHSAESPRLPIAATTDSAESPSLPIAASTDSAESIDGAPDARAHSGESLRRPPARDLDVGRQASLGRVPAERRQRRIPVCRVGVPLAVPIAAPVGGTHHVLAREVRDGLLVTPAATNASSSQTLGRPQRARRPTATR